jgi:hypothetical protein
VGCKQSSIVYLIFGITEADVAFEDRLSLPSDLALKIYQESFHIFIV